MRLINADSEPMRCPECGRNTLYVTAYTSHDGAVFAETAMQCVSCGATSSGD